ncbi:S-adenosyl-L-methionine-dependent tRNA 4-demethylwyosine synthase TYW1 isoform X2 [Syngnathoides biaculeatus]|uniref:S-adenosyl-L-methionine-dependent tRNA 4-demethylwyosine synthase TYW1 isoform X2 n=1 Tax=Syngnathoides biaculeatus TaxID=300417 RepID=UPI002ADE4E1B|nr:S-adenosyl-L-methionine-dependent tRNA 4-demethylwyosine synthase TYW1 isoform X2 [Syngnathoides biaculeatus]
MCSYKTFAAMHCFNVLTLLFGSCASSSETKVVHSSHSAYENYITYIWHNRLYLYTAAAFTITLWFALKIFLKKKSLSKDVVSSWVQEATKNDECCAKRTEVHISGVKIFFGSQTGTAKSFAKELSGDVRSLGLPAEVLDMKEYDPDDRLAAESSSKCVCVFLVATYTDGQPTDNAGWFCKWLEEASTDFRYGKTYLKGLRYAVFGLGNSLYASNYNTVGKNVDKWLWMLSASRILTRGEGDCNVAKSANGSVQADFQAWKLKFLKHLRDLCRDDGNCCGKREKGTSCVMTDGQEVDAYENAALDSNYTESLTPSQEEPVESSSDDDDSSTSPSVLDMEDLGSLMSSVKQMPSDGGQVAKRSRKMARKSQEEKEEERREMITPALREALSKQGYKLIGSHSGVKLCRWTKSMLRGRGGCYKHTFYGIQSHRCMETTPSLACANKCVFCWRHHTNPVGTEWRWKMDPAEKILQDALEKHQDMIRQFRGVPGVKLDRYEEGLMVQHCALSLVGEPIMYPEINRFVRLLHSRRISSFLVTNAQFPKEIRSLEPVTQLYVSVDASTKDSLKKIDRPLFKDFWTRFLDSLKALAEKRQRTVYRLTLVKSWNVDELKAYSELVALGQPDFIEVKGVTYCGESSASNLTMANVPWHREVVDFTQQLLDMLPDYEIACEHEHSNCLLIAHSKFKVDGEWRTWIDYERFQDLARAHLESGGRKAFSALDYTAPTPHWALFGAREQGFDPAESRFQRRNKGKDISGC